MKHRVVVLVVTLLAVMLYQSIHRSTALQPVVTVSRGHDEDIHPSLSGVDEAFATRHRPSHSVPSEWPSIDFDPQTVWLPHNETPPSTICFSTLNVWQPCTDRLQCEFKGKLRFPCRDRVFYDDDVWDFCNPIARLRKEVYVMNPPLHLRNDSVSDAQVWETVSLPLRRAWSKVHFPSVSVDTAGPSVADTALRMRAADKAYPSLGLSDCPPEKRQAVVGFAAKYMRPFQVMALVLSALDVWPNHLGNSRCTRMHLFVSQVSHPLLLLLRALGTANLTVNPYDMSPQQLVDAERAGEFSQSFLILEDFESYESTLGKSKGYGNNNRVEVVRINVAKWWTRYGMGRLYHDMLFLDTRDAVFKADPFSAVRKTLYRNVLDLGMFTKKETRNDDDDTPQTLSQFMYAASEEFPFFRQPRLGIKWNIEVHTTTFGFDMMTLMQKLHLDDYPYMRLINSGVYGGTYTALLDLFELWGASTAAVHTETFGVDQPVLGGLMYFGLRLAGYSHRVFLISGSDGPLRHLYTDGGTDPTYPFMRLELPNGERVWSRDFMLDYAANTSDIPNEVHELNCLGERYAIIHQADRYPVMWRSLTEPIARQAVDWAKRFGVEYTWGPRKPKKKKARA